MTVLAAQIARLRRMTAEPTDATYSDALLTTIIETYQTVDKNGESPLVPSTILPGTLMANPDWTETYDLHMAAAEIWEEKAAAVAHKFDFNADGGSYSASQVKKQYTDQVRWHLARRNPGTIILVVPETRERTYETNRA
jgi:hypothetical protein